MVVIVNVTEQTKEIIMRSEEEVIEAIERYSRTIRRLCMIHLKNYADI
mgnify:FL=1